MTEWKGIKLSEMSLTIEHSNTIQLPTGSYISKKKLENGNIPRITVTSLNNGIDGFYNNNANIRYHNNFISLSFLGSSFYHGYTASIDMKVHCIKPKNIKLNKDVALFICRIIDNNKSFISYGNQLSSTDATSLRINLPVIYNSTPDYQYMECFVKNKRLKLLQKYKQYAESILKQLQHKDIKSLNECEWKDFFLSDIFNEIERGKRLKKADHIIGNIPYVSSTSFNNGIDSFIGNETKVRTFSNCLSLANSGSVGSCFFEPFKFVASDHITHLKNDNFNKFIYLFISNVLKIYQNKYNFNKEINNKRINREKIILPTTSSNKPDYEYMEQYIKNLMYKKYNQYLNYIQNQL